ncbi:Mbov_0396 family ICE element transmembrane protein [[Mycoplasma] collis]|uniref:Mbov_0396 family ICE element transmembrane protein n=1 Tax=[Mycoplasma] collis TaxID=2127 RepID=UPI00051C068A|nr:hypothetical protein [[Mycoplasma] collis]
MFNPFQPVIDGITYLFFIAGWYLLIYFPLIILYIILKIFQFFSIEFLEKVIFGGEGFSWNSIPTTYKALIIIATILFIVLSITLVFKFAVKLPSNQEENTLVQFTRKIVPSIASIILIPILTFAIFIILQIFLDLFQKATNGQFSNPTKLILVNNKPDSFSEEDWKNALGPNEWDFNVINFSDYQKLHAGEGIKLIVFVGIASIVIFIAIIKIFTSFVIKFAELFFLFIVSPLFGIWSVYDNGEKFKQWKKIYVGKISIIIVYQVLLKLAFIWIAYSNQASKYINLDLPSVLNSIANGLLSLFFMIAGFFAIQTLAAEASQLLNISESHHEANRMIGGTAKALAFAGGLALGAGGLAFKARSKVTGALAKRDIGLKKFYKDYKEGNISKAQYNQAKKELKEQRKELGLGWSDTKSGWAADTLHGINNFRTKRREHYVNKIDKKQNKLNKIINSDNFSKLSAKKQNKILNKNNRLNELKEIRKPKIEKIQNKLNERKTKNAYALDYGKRNGDGSWRLSSALEQKRKPKVDNSEQPNIENDLNNSEQPNIENDLNNSEQPNIVIEFKQHQEKGENEKAE